MLKYLVNAFPTHFSIYNSVFLNIKLGILSLTYFSRANRQQAAGQACFAIYHPDHLVWDTAFRKS